MAEKEVMSNVIRAIIVVAVIFVLIAIAYIFFQKFYPIIRELPEAQKEQAKNNFDQFIANLKACQALTSSDCVCKVFPSWPGSFPRNSVLEIERVGAKTQINLTYHKKEISSAELDLKLGATWPSKEQVKYSSWKKIDFRHEPPFFVSEHVSGWRHFDKLVASAWLYKRSKEQIDFVLSDKAIEIEKQISECK